jgi:hypothetical protein
MNVLATVESLYCPTCGVYTRRAEWRLIFRRVKSSSELPPAKVLRHFVCSEIVYFLLK